MEKQAIFTEQLTKYYGKARGIKNLDLAVAPGEFFGFIGPNGAGKSTTIRTLLGLITANAGKARVAEVGPLMEYNPMFPNRANIEFAQVLDRHHIRMRVWERGSGITYACGTGACATAVASAMQGYTDPQECEVTMDGGALTVSWDPVTKEVLMKGDAESVFDGVIELPDK